MGSAIWQINQNTLVEFSNTCPGLVDPKIYNINGVLLQEQTVKSNPLDKAERSNNKNKNVPDNIIRHQFLSLLVKVAKDKYITRSKNLIFNTAKTFTSTNEAVRFALTNNFLPAMQGFNVHDWRMERYYNEYVDNFLKAHLPLLDAIYKSWAPRKDPGRKE